MANGMPNCTVKVAKCPRYTAQIFPIQYRSIAQHRDHAEGGLAMSIQVGMPGAARRQPGPSIRRLAIWVMGCLTLLIGGVIATSSGPSHLQLIDPPRDLLPGNLL